MLKKRDSKRAKAMDTPSERNNKVRLIRALEIATHLEKVGPFPSSKDRPFQDILWIGVSPSATVLDKKIRTRLLARMDTGMVAEARRLKKGGLSYKRMRELGLEYRSLADLLEKKITKDEMVEILYREIRRYARKQTSYWNRNKEIHWFDPKDTSKITALVKKWLLD